MIDIYFTDYETYMDSLAKAEQKQESICIHFSSFLEHLKPVEQILVLQMSIAKLHVPCTILFPYEDSLPINRAEYEVYKKELQKLRSVSFVFELS